MTGLTKSTSLVNLYNEYRWDSLSKRRYFQKVCIMYKCSNNIVPDYISDIVPPLVGEVTNYPIRNRHNIASMYTRTEISRKSCIPSSVSGWNNLNNNIRESDSYVSFRSTFKNDVLGNAQVPFYFMKGQRRLSVLHARLRNNCSDLKSDLFQNHLTDSLSCSCGNVNESAIHYFFECENYSNPRLVKFRSIRKCHPLSLNTVLFGKSNLSDDDNFLLFQAVQQ